MTHTLRHQVIITGTGRAGTTFLVQLLTELGQDTGFRPGEWGDGYHEHCRAGLEHDLAAPDAPYILKNPALCDSLGEILARGELVIDHALVPVRDLAEAAQSRIRVGGDGKTPGGLTGTANEAEQQHVLAERFHRLVHTLAAHRIPVTFLEFPRFARDAGYTFAALRPLLPDTTWPQFAAAFARVARPELIHQFDGRRAADAGEPARRHAQSRTPTRTARHRRRWRVAAGLAAVLGLSGWIGANATADRADEAANDAAAAAFVPVKLTGPRTDAAAAGSTWLHLDEDPTSPAHPTAPRRGAGRVRAKAWREKSI